MNVDEWLSGVKEVIESNKKAIYSYCEPTYESDLLVKNNYYLQEMVSILSPQPDTISAASIMSASTVTASNWGGIKTIAWDTSPKKPQVTNADTATINWGKTPATVTVGEFPNDEALSLAKKLEKLETYKDMVVNSTWVTGVEDV